MLNYSWVFANMFRHLVTHGAVWHFHNGDCQIKPERIVEHLRRNQSWPKFLNLESNQSGEHQCGHFPSDPWMGAHHYKLKWWRVNQIRIFERIVFCTNYCEARLSSYYAGNLKEMRCPNYTLSRAQNSLGQPILMLTRWRLLWNVMICGLDLMMSAR